MRRLWAAMTLLLAFGLSGCFPQVMVTQPDLTLHIQDERGEAVAAQVTLYWWEYPHRRQRSVVTVATASQGTVSFAESTETEIMVLVLPHGMPAYNWTFCVEAADYKTLIGTVHDVAPGERITVSLTLPEGKSLRVCDNFERLPSHPGTPVEEVQHTGGEVQGVYVVDAVNDR